jgi:ceramide glucosyltransferase
MSHQNIPKSSPFVSLIIPVTGESSDLAANVKTLIDQRYNFFDIIFVLQDQKDSATPIIAKITKEHDQATHIFSGKATSCSQKNHNLLAGIQKIVNKPDILLFCDSGHIAPPDWLSTLVLPLREDASCIVTSGYHQIYPKNHCICSQGRAICVLTLSLIRKLPFLGQPWGGATAIRRKDFEHIVVAETWKENIVDDVSLAKILQMQKIKTTIPPHTDLQTYLQDITLRNWMVWLTRQWAYLKFIFPVLWFVTGMLSVIVATATLMSFGILATSLVFPFSRTLLQYSLLCILSFFIFTCFLYFKHPAPGTFFSWLPASLAAIAMAAYCHMRTWFSDVIHWANIRYRVGKNGKVIHLERETSITTKEKQ